MAVRHRRDDAGRPHATAIGVDRAAGLLEGRGAAHAAAPEDAESLGVDTADCQPRLARGLLGRGKRHRGRTIERQARGCGDRARIEVGRRERHQGNVEPRQVDGVGPHCGSAGEQRLVERIDADADRADDAAAADDDRRPGAAASR